MNRRTTAAIAALLAVAGALALAGCKERSGVRPARSGRYDGEERNGFVWRESSAGGEEGGYWEMPDELVDYYGCPNSRRVRKLNLRKTRRML